MKNDSTIAKRSEQRRPRFIPLELDAQERLTTSRDAVTPKRHMTLLRRFRGQQTKSRPPIEDADLEIAAAVFQSVRSRRLNSAQAIAKSTAHLEIRTVQNETRLHESNRNNAPNPIEPANNSGYTRAMDSTLDIYSDHFGLQQRPFSLVPDPNCIYWSSSHRRAYTMLEYGILTNAPITLITGEVGAGKTTLLQHLLKNMGENVKIGLISNAHGSRGELLQWVLMSLDQPAPDGASYVSLFDTFQKYLISEYAQGNRVILIFDEAQNLSRETLEELRMFTNINANSDVLLQLVLVGQPELRATVRRQDLRQFAQRVAASFHLEAMDARTVSAYIGHRLRMSGAERNLFSETASDLVYDATGGIPRLVNQLCDLSMVYAFTKNQKTVTRTTIQQVLDDGAFFGAGEFSPGNEADE
ncbi:MAG: AAA family ATPase [Paracoccaceae bacterium]